MMRSSQRKKVEVADIGKPCRDSGSGDVLNGTDTVEENSIWVNNCF